MSWGIQPAAMIGHSIGEYVAACIAGVFSLEDALKLVAARGLLMQQQPHGAMLSVPLSASEVQSWLTDNLSLAANNSPSSCVVSGTVAAVEQLANTLAAKGVQCRRLCTSHAFHSQMMDSISGNEKRGKYIDGDIVPLWLLTYLPVAPLLPPSLIPHS